MKAVGGLYLLGYFKYFLTTSGGYVVRCNNN